MKLYKYHGAGNDFLLADNRNGSITLTEDDIRALCDRHTGIGADGLMILYSAYGYDFGMEYFNSDGSGGMMCGNGGRCIAAFARDLGVKANAETPPVETGTPLYYRFLAPDGPHEAFIYEDGTVCLKMKDVTQWDIYIDKVYFLDTGTRHAVRFVEDVESIDIETEGPKLRHDGRFSPTGVNANFVQTDGDELIIRTFEKGVEGETLACGTGIVASALAECLKRSFTKNEIFTLPQKTIVRSRIARLCVEFTPALPEHSIIFRDVWLTGPTQRICSIETS